MPSLGDFQNLSLSYKTGRRGFNDEVFTFISQRMGGIRGKKILDVGCGTGIATRQLKQYGANVTGSDISSKMIARAREENDNIQYIVAPSSKLPFSDGSFDIVTAFSAFHWFADSASIIEIQRIIKPDGSFVVINKNDVGGIRKDVNQLFKKYKRDKAAKTEYNPEDILRDAGFAEVTTHICRGTETFTREQAISYLQSIALWNLVPEDEKQKMQDRITNFCNDTLAQSGILQRNVETITVLGVMH